MTNTVTLTQETDMSSPFPGSPRSIPVVQPKPEEVASGTTGDGSSSGYGPTLSERLGRNLGRKSMQRTWATYKERPIGESGDKALIFHHAPKWTIATNTDPNLVQPQGSGSSAIVQTTFAPALIRRKGMSTLEPALSVSQSFPSQNGVDQQRAFQEIKLPALSIGRSTATLQIPSVQNSWQQYEMKHGGRHWPTPSDKWGDLSNGRDTAGCISLLSQQLNQALSSKLGTKRSDFSVAKQSQFQGSVSAQHPAQTTIIPLDLAWDSSEQNLAETQSGRSSVGGSGGRGGVGGETEM